jgi:hypothetical protein
MESNATPTILSKEKKKSPNITLSLKGQRIKELQGFHNQNQDVPYIKQYAPLVDMKGQPNKLKTDIPLPEISYILRCISGDYQDYQVPINTCGVDIELAPEEIAETVQHLTGAQKSGQQHGQDLAEDHKTQTGFGDHIQGKQGRG